LCGISLSVSKYTLVHKDRFIPPTKLLEYVICHYKVDCNTKVMTSSGMRNNFDFQLSGAVYKMEIYTREERMEENKRNRNVRKERGK